jgi:hypothetical protein
MADTATVATTEDTTILGSPTETTQGDPSAGSGAPSATPNDGKPGPGTPNGSVQDPTKPTAADGKQAQGQVPKPQAPAVPETYTLQVPDGLTLDEAVLGEFTGVAKELKLSNEQAQKLVDLQSKVTLKATEDARAEYQAMKASWETDAKKMLGNEANKQLALAAKARDKFGSSGLTEILNQSGLGSHPEVIKFFVSVGKAISEDTFAEGKPIGGSKDKTAGEILYPNLPKK